MLASMATSLTRYPSGSLATAAIIAMLCSTSAGCLTYSLATPDRTKAGVLTATAVEAGAALALGGVFYAISRSDDPNPVSIPQALGAASLGVVLVDLALASVFLLVTAIDDSKKACRDGTGPCS